MCLPLPRDRSRTRLSSSILAESMCWPLNWPVGMAASTSDRGRSLVASWPMPNSGRTRRMPSRHTARMIWLRRFCRNGAGWPAADPPGWLGPVGLPLAPSPFGLRPVSVFFWKMAGNRAMARPPLPGEGKDIPSFGTGLGGLEARSAIPRKPEGIWQVRVCGRHRREYHSEGLPPPRVIRGTIQEPPGLTVKRGGRLAAVSPAGELEPTPAQPGTPPVAPPAVLRLGL